MKVYLSKSNGTNTRVVSLIVNALFAQGAAIVSFYTPVAPYTTEKLDNAEFFVHIRNQKTSGVLKEIERATALGLPICEVELVQAEGNIIFRGASLSEYTKKHRSSKQDLSSMGTNAGFGVVEEYVQPSKRDLRILLLMQ